MGMKVNKVLNMVGLSKNQYYYRPKTARPGRKPSTNVTLDQSNGIRIVKSNDELMDQIVNIQQNPVLDYGYRAMTKALNLIGYVVNHKKVYRLMKAHHLLQDKPKRTARNYVKYRSVYPDHPLQYLEMDIKFQWVEQHQRFAFILTVIDCHTRYALAWTVAYSIKQEQVKAIWDRLIRQFLQPNDLLKKQVHIELRNDNDSRFAAKNIQTYFKENHIDQVFTHPYTPQENGHIESFHSILSRSLKHQYFKTITDLELHLNKFYNSYNYKRLHGSLDHLPPSLFWRLWNDDLIEVKKIKANKTKFKLKIPHYELSGKGYLRGVSCLPVGHPKEVYGAMTLQQPSVQRSPSVVSC